MTLKGLQQIQLKNQWSFYLFGPVVIIDTPGFDDEGELGEKRVETTRRILRNCDVAVLVTVAGRELNKKEQELIDVFKEREIPYIIVKNKVDLVGEKLENKDNIVYSSAKENIGIEDIKNLIGASVKSEKQEVHLVSDLINPKDIVVLVTPIDDSAPKGRLILPQQLAIRDILDKNGIVVVVQDSELEETLKNVKPKLVVTDSQVFRKVKNIVPENIYLTSFSILMARYKGFLDTAVKGVRAIDNLQDGSKILISEGCTHHRQCEDIGTVKIPKWLKNYTGKDLKFEWTSGMGFPDDLSEFDLVIHCRWMYVK